MKPKFWLLLITQNRAKELEEMLKETYDIFDGIVAVDHFSTDESFNILNKYKKQGKITQLPYSHHHGWSMNGALFSGVIKNLDYFLIFDSSDRLSSDWAKSIKQDIDYYSQNGIGTVYLDRIFIARYYDGMEFFSGIHWGLKGTRGKSIGLLDNDKKRDDFVINTRMKNRNISGIEHPIRYFVEFSSNSQCDLLYGQFGQEVLDYHINERLKFRIYCQQVLGLAPTVEELVKYLSDGITNKNLPAYIIEYCDLEVNMIDLVRYYILKQDLLSEIAENRFSWSFKKFYHEGKEHQNKNDGYVGTFNKYRLAQGLEIE